MLCNLRNDDIYDIISFAYECFSSKHSLQLFALLICPLAILSYLSQCYLIRLRMWSCMNEKLFFFQYQFDSSKRRILKNGKSSRCTPTFFNSNFPPVVSSCNSVLIPLADRIIGETFRHESFALFLLLRFHCFLARRRSCY